MLAFLPQGFEIWAILLVILVLFGGAKLPKLARSIGQASNEFKAGLAEGDKDKPADGTTTAPDSTKS